MFFLLFPVISERVGHVVESFCTCLVDQRYIQTIAVALAAIIVAVVKMTSRDFDVTISRAVEQSIITITPSMWQ